MPLGPAGPARRSALPPRLTDDERAAIANEIRIGAKSAHEIARQFGRAIGTVSKIARDAGLSFDRSRTKEATEAAKTDARARRIVLAHRLLDEAEGFLSALHQPAELINWYQGHANLMVRMEPTFQDQKALMVSAAIALEKHEALERLDAGDEDAARGALRALMDEVRMEAERA